MIEIVRKEMWTPPATRAQSITRGFLIYWLSYSLCRTDFDIDSTPNWITIDLNILGPGYPRRLIADMRFRWRDAIISLGYPSTGPQNLFGANPGADWTPELFVDVLLPIWIEREFSGLIIMAVDGR